MKPHFPRCPRPRGQALLEMTVMLVGIVAILLGVVYVGGLTVANNRLLLSAKFNAEKAARQPDSVVQQSDGELRGWSYTTLEVSSRKKITIPFLADDRLSSSTDVSTLSSVSSGFRNATPSESDFYSYSWHSPRDFDRRLNGDFADTAGNALNAAALVRGTDSLRDPISGFDRGERDNASFAMRNAFQAWFGVRITGEMLGNIPSNQVYMPHIPYSESQP